MSKIVLILFLVLTLVSGYMTYQGTLLEGVSSEQKSVRSSHSGVWFGGGSRSSSGGFSSGK